jgi:hypothetical protein
VLQWGLLLLGLPGESLVLLILKLLLLTRLLLMMVTSFFLASLILGRAGLESLISKGLLKATGKK